MKIIFETESLTVRETERTIDMTVVPTLTTAKKVVDMDGKILIEVTTKKASFARPIAVQYFTIQDLQALGKIAADIAKGGTE